jgi:hypothetical protein
MSFLFWEKVEILLSALVRSGDTNESRWQTFLPGGLFRLQCFRFQYYDRSISCAQGPPWLRNIIRHSEIVPLLEPYRTATWDTLYLGQPMLWGGWR